MSKGKGIAGELSVGEVISKTFEIYRVNFVKYFLLFVVVGVIVGILNTIVQNAVVLPALPAGAGLQEFLSWAPGFFGAIVTILFLNAIITLVFSPLGQGAAIKMTSDEIVSGNTDLGASVRYIASKLIWIWGLGLVVAVLVILGLVALIVPGIILAIMFSLSLPALLLQNTGIMESLTRSRELVAHRWWKTFATFFFVIIIFAIASGVLNAIGGLFGPARTFVSSVLSAFYQPIIPIALTVYYYSNVARTSATQAGQPPAAPNP